MKAVRIEGMRRAEARLIASGTPGYTLMRRAGRGRRNFCANGSGGGAAFRRVVAVIGRGNNAAMRW